MSSHPGTYGTISLIQNRKQNHERSLATHILIMLIPIAVSLVIFFPLMRISHLFSKTLMALINITEYSLCARHQKWDGEGKINRIIILKNFTTQWVKRQVNSYGKAINNRSPPKNPLCQCAAPLLQAVQIHSIAFFTTSVHICLVLSLIPKQLQHQT